MIIKLAGIEKNNLPTYCTEDNKLSLSIFLSRVTALTPELALQLLEEKTLDIGNPSTAVLVGFSNLKAFGIHVDIMSKKE